MKKSKLVVLLTVSIISALLVSSIAFASDTNYGSQGAKTLQSYTLEDMLKYAIQDEYLAKAEYEEIMVTFDVTKPFSNIIKSEDQHINLLIPLFEKYGIQLPEDTSSEYTVVPDSLLSSLKIGVEAEINNIAMYEAFLKQELSDDVRDVFTRLKNASENHLKAFENGVQREESSNSTGSNSAGSKGRRNISKGR